MPTIKDTAICLRRWDFSETSQTVRLFGRTVGAFRGLAKGAKRERGAFSGGFDVVTTGEIMAIIKPGRDLATLTAWHLQQTFPHVRQDLSANRAALFMVDATHHLLIDHDPHEALFDELIETLRCLADRRRVPTKLLRFLWSLLRETGYQPDLSRDTVTGEALELGARALHFLPERGGFTARIPSPGAWQVRRATVERLRAIDATARAGDAGTGSADQDDVDTRAGHLLGSYLRTLVEGGLPSLDWAFPPRS